MNGLIRQPTNPDPGERAKWEFLLAVPERDARDYRVQAVARYLLGAAYNNVRTFLHLAHALARDGIRYERDIARVGSEDIAGLTRPPEPRDPIDALVRGRDDCDAKARLFVALCIAAGRPARMVGWWRETGHGTQMLAHVSAEAFLDRGWMPVELTLARARLGETGAQVPKERSGAWMLT